MKTGMLWLDSHTTRSLEEKVRRAAEYYQNKYGEHPNLCHVHGKALDNDKAFGNIQVRPMPNIALNHFWLGVTA